MRTIWRILASGVLAIACVWGVRAFVYRPYDCNRRISQLTAATRAAEELRGEFAREGRIDRTLAELEALQSQCRADVQIPLLIGANHALAGRWERAVTAYDAALRLDHRPEIYTARGDALVQLARVEDAVESYLAAARFGANPFSRIRSEVVARRVRERLESNSPAP